MKPRKPVMKVDHSLISEERREELRLEAQQKIDAERVKSAEDDYLKKAELELRRAHDPDEEMIEITLDLAEHSDRITIDGVMYFHGYTYKVPLNTYRTILEIQSRGWDHQAIVDGKNVNSYRKAHNLRISPVHGTVNTSQLQRA
jgi:hypothetical protein